MKEEKSIVEVFGEKSKDADELKASVLDIVRLLEGVGGQGETKDWDFGSFLSSPMTPHQEVSKEDQIENLKNVILERESYENGGRVGSDYYKTLESVAKEKDFDLNKLTDMFVIESSANPEAVNPLGYTGGFQFGEKAGREYGLIGEGFDYRKDLGKSAGAAIDMYRANLRDKVQSGSGKEWSLSEKYGDMGISEGLAGYLAHQQGRFGLIDMLTGAESGKISGKTREAMLANVGDEDFSSLGDKDLVNEFLGFWKGRHKKKLTEAENWRKENRPT
tara:strand:+ start:326 stop:1153 length:828 start_codon:yes stop_codon:yes gene_type:complete